MSRIQVSHRALMACLAVTLLVVLPTHAQVFEPFPYIPMSPLPPLPPSQPPPRCCVPSVITPPAMMGCASPCDGSADCSGETSEAEYTSAYCIQPPAGGGWCGRTGESIYVPEYVCMAAECTINGEPGEQCRWIFLFGGGWSGIGLKCSAGATICN